MIDADRSDLEKSQEQYIQSLSDNRELISMLKDQVKKGLDKQKDQIIQMSAHKEKIQNLQQQLNTKESVVQNKNISEKQCQTEQTIESIIKQDEDEFKKQQLLQQQITNLRNQFSDKFSDSEEQLRKLKFFNVQKEQQLQSAISQVEILKKQINNSKQKLVQLLSSHNLKINQDDELNLQLVVNEVQNAFKFQKNQAIDINRKNKTQIAEVEKQLSFSIEILNELEKTHQQNKAQFSQLSDKSQRKIQNYKNLIAQMKKKQNTLFEQYQKEEKQKSDLIIQQYENEKQLMYSKLQNQLQELIDGKRNMDRLQNELNEKQIQLNEQIILQNDLQKELTEIKSKEVILPQNKQIDKEQTQSEQSDDDMSSSKCLEIEQLEIENMGLINKLQNSEREIQNLREQLHAIKQAKNDDKALQAQNNNQEPDNKIQEIKVQFNQLKHKVQISFTDLLSENINNIIEMQFENKPQESLQKQESLLDDLQLEEQKEQTQITKEQKVEVLSSDTQLQINKLLQNPLNVNQLIALVKFILEMLNNLILRDDFENNNQCSPKDELLNLYNNFVDLRIKVEDNVELLDQKDIIIMKDNLQFFQAENLELNQKLKSLVIRINDLQEEKSQQIPNDNNFHFKKQQQKTSEAGSIDISSIDLEIENNCDLMDHSQNIIVNNDTLRSFNQIQEDPESSFQSSQLKEQQTLISEVQSDISANQQNIQSKSTNSRYSQISEKIDQLIQQAVNFENQKQCKDKLQCLANELKVKIQDLKKLEVADKQQNKFDQDNSSQSFASNQSSNSQYQNLFQHIKATLILYLKKNPIIDIQNETLLKIIQSMMKFTQDEIIELEQTRKKLPTYVIDKNFQKKIQNLLSQKKQNDQIQKIDFSSNKNTPDKIQNSQQIQDSEKQIKTTQIEPAKQEINKTDHEDKKTFSKAKQVFQGLFSKKNESKQSDGFSNCESVQSTNQKNIYTIKKQQEQLIISSFQNEDNHNSGSANVTGQKQVAFGEVPNKGDNYYNVNPSCAYDLEVSNSQKQKQPPAKFQVHKNNKN